MGRVDTPQLLGTEAKDLDEFNDLLRRLVLAFNSLVSFGDGTDEENIDGEWLTVADSGSADTEFSVSHTLARVPTGFLVMKIDKGGVVYDSGTTWTTTALKLKCSVANANITLFTI